MNHETHEKAFTEAQINEWVWKTPAMKAMTLAVCRLALARGMAGEFSAMDLALRGAEAQGGTGIAGSVFRQLSTAGIIGFACDWTTDGRAVPRTVTNAGGNPIKLYRLLSAPLARALIHRHAPAEHRPAVQQEMDWQAKTRAETRGNDSPAPLTSDAAAAAASLVNTTQEAA
jgi:hypothetical protein